MTLDSHVIGDSTQLQNYKVVSFFPKFKQKVKQHPTFPRKINETNMSK